MLNVMARLLLTGLLLIPMMAQAQTDTQGPGLVLAGPVSPGDDQTLLAVFDEPVDATTSQQASNYVLIGGPMISQAQIHAEHPNWISLTLATGMNTGINFTLRVFNVTDLSGNPIRSEAMQSATFRYCNLLSETAQILNCALPSGALAMSNGTPGWTAGEPIWIEPYFAHMAALGLLKAYQINPSQAYLDAVHDWLEWYADHMQADGTVTTYTGNYPDYSSTGTYDSSDSYAAFFLVVADEYLQISNDSGFLETIYPSVIKAVSAMEMTLQSDHLTWAKPTYLVKYTMDNCEVWWGYRSAAALATLKSETVQAAQWQTTAQQVRQAVLDELYLPAQDLYSVGKFSSGALAQNDFTQWYADGMAQCFPINFIHDSQDARAQAVWAKVKQQFAQPTAPASGIGYQFAWAAQTMGEPSMAALGYADMICSKQSYNYLNEAANVLLFLSRQSSPSVPVTLSQLCME